MREGGREQAREGRRNEGEREQGREGGARSILSFIILAVIYSLQMLLSDCPERTTGAPTWQESEGQPLT